MIAKYNNEIFKARQQGENVRLRKYSFIDGFKKKTNDEGYNFYEKVVPVSELEELFGFIFFVKWNEHEYNVDYLVNSDRIVLHVGSYQASSQYDIFEEVEHGVLEAVVEPDECYDYKVRIYDKLSNNQQTEISLTYDEFVDTWNKYVDDLRFHERG